MPEISVIDQIKLNVLTALGNPPNILKVDVKPIGEVSYRVNVWTKDDVESILPCGKITHSEVVTLEASVAE